MRFRTEIPAESLRFPIHHSDRLILLGSCFAEHIGARLEASGFLTDVNPFGVLYNPLSVASGISALMQNKVYTREDIFEDRGLYASFAHHSRFSASTAEACLEGINRRMRQSSAFLREASVLLITFGTSFVFRLKETGEVVSNCHKMPASLFDRQRLTVSDMSAEWKCLLVRLKEYNPKLRILFTVSPIRHWKDGAHGNQLSKAALLLTIDELERAGRKHPEYPPMHYFPSYELVLDDLRDYRYYAEDMLHPSSLAVDYIWEKFSETCFDRATGQAVNEFRKIQQVLQHRPFHPESETYRQLLEKTRLQEAAFRKRYS